MTGKKTRRQGKCLIFALKFFSVLIFPSFHIRRTKHIHIYFYFLIWFVKRVPFCYQFFFFILFMSFLYYVGF